MAGTLLTAVILTAVWAILDLRFAAQTGLTYAVYAPDAGFEGEPVAQGTVAVPALRGDGVSPSDERRLTRGVGRREVRWSGLWFVAVPGPYKLFAAGNGDIVVRVDGELVVSHPAASDRAVSGTIQLNRGFHRLVVLFSRSRPGQRPWMVVHQAPLGEAPRPFDPQTLLPRRADEQRHVWNRWASRLRGASLVAWGMAAFLLALPWLRSGLARLPAAAARVRFASDALTVAGVLGSGLFAATTLFQHELSRQLGFSWSVQLNLQGEGNLAAWWSGALLLLAGFYAVDAAVASGRPPGGFRDGEAAAPAGDGARVRANSARLGWSCLALVWTALSADEIGGFHEHMGELLGWSTWWAIAPFALALAGVLAVGFRRLWRVRPLRRVTLVLLLGVAVLGSVPPILEVLEHGRDWGIAGHWWHPYNLRGAAEESSELLGILILLHACAAGRRRTLAGSRRAADRLAGPEAPALRRPLLLLGWPAAVGAALVSPALPGEMAPEAWLASAIFLLAAVRTWFHRTDLPGGRGLAGIALVGSAAGTVFDSWSPFWLGFAAALTMAWADARVRRREAPGWWLPISCLALGLAPFVVGPPWRSLAGAAVPALMGLTALALAPSSRR